MLLRLCVYVMFVSVSMLYCMTVNEKMNYQDKVLEMSWKKRLLKEWNIGNPDYQSMYCDSISAQSIHFLPDFSWCSTWAIELSRVKVKPSAAHGTLCGTLPERRSILQLRSHPLGVPSDSNFCSQLSDLSVEQRFDISYLELGELFFWGISLLFPLELKLIDCQQLNLVLELVSYSSFYFTVATFD